MVGQTKLITKINTYTLDSFPRTIMLVGPFGSGKHSLCQLISNKLKLRLFDISDRLNLETIDNIYTDIEPSIYTINGEAIAEQEEAVILKFLEEPPMSSYIIVLCENKYNMLNTIINRCQVWELESYSREELMQFTVSSKLLDVATTPGEIIAWSNQPIEEITNLCYLMLDKIPTSNVANILTIADRIAFKKGDKGYDIQLFFRLLSKCSLHRILETNNSTYFSMYNKINLYINSHYGLSRDKRKLFEHLLFELRKEIFNDNKGTES